MRYIFSICLLLLCGCIHDVDSIAIMTTHQWENHYFSVEEFKAGTAQMQLDRGESIWVMSNTTFKKILDEVKKKDTL